MSTVVFVVWSLNEHTRFALDNARLTSLCGVCEKDVSARMAPTPEASFRVPNIVHYCWYTNEPRSMRYIDYLSVLSAVKVLKPDKIYIHMNMEPVGRHWDAIRKLPRVAIHGTNVPTEILGEKLKEGGYFTEPSNICRIKQIMEYGGIYLDFDVIVVKPFDELRKYECTVGRENSFTGRMCGGIIICAKQSPFIRMWANSYLDDYQLWVWAYNSGIKPYQLAKRFPDLVHVEETSLNQPNWEKGNLEKLWANGTWNWKEDNHAITRGTDVDYYDTKNTHVLPSLTLTAMKTCRQ